MPKRDLVRRIDKEVAAAAAGVLSTRGGSGGLVPHDLNSPWHIGPLGDSQAPQFLKHDGSRLLTGNLGVVEGKTIDGVDLSNLIGRYIIAGPGITSDAADAVPPTVEVLFVDDDVAHNPRLSIKLAEVTPALAFDAANGIHVLVDPDHGLDAVDAGLRVDIEQLAGGGLVPDTVNWELDLGLPATLSAFTANTVTEDSHIHAVTAYENHYLESNRGHLVRTTPDTGRLTVNIARALGELRTPHIIWDGPAEGDGIIVQNITVESVGDIVLDPSGEQVLPGGSVTRDLGAYNRLWRTLYVAQLYAYQLVAEDIMSTIGGYLRVAPTTTLIEDFLPGATALRVAHNQPRTGDYLVMQTAPGGIPQFEVVQVLSGPVAVTGGYEYTVARNVGNTLSEQVSYDPGSFDFWYYGFQPEQLESDLLCKSVEGMTLSGGVMWYKGDAVVNLGSHAGDGYIDLTSSFTVFEEKNPERVHPDGEHVTHHGPSITFYVRRSGLSWNDMRPMIVLGNLDGLAGYGTGRMDSPDPVMGLAMGKDLYLEPGLTPQQGSNDYFQGLTLDYDNGLRLFNTDYKQFYWNASTRTWRQTVEMLANGTVKFGLNVNDPNLAGGFYFDPVTGNITVGKPSGNRMVWDQATGTLTLTGASMPDFEYDWDKIVAAYQGETNPEFGFVRTTILGNGYIVVGTHNQPDLSDLTGVAINNLGIVARKQGALQAAMTTSGEFVAGFDAGETNLADHYVRLDGAGLTLYAPEVPDGSPLLDAASLTFRARGLNNVRLGYLGAGFEETYHANRRYVRLGATIDSAQGIPAGEVYWSRAQLELSAEHYTLPSNQRTRLLLYESGMGSSAQIDAGQFSLVTGELSRGEQQVTSLWAHEGLLETIWALQANAPLILKPNSGNPAYGLPIESANLPRLYADVADGLLKYRKSDGTVITLSGGGGGGGGSFPVEIVDPQANDLLVYDAGSAKWRNRHGGTRLNVGSRQSTEFTGGVLTLPSSGSHFAVRASDGNNELHTIVGGNDGDVIVLSARTGVTVVVSNNGNIRMSGDSDTLDQTLDRMVLQYDGTLGLWLALSSSNNSLP